MNKNRILNEKIIINDKELQTGDEVNLNVFRFDWLHGCLSKINKEERTIVIVDNNTSMRVKLDHIIDAC